MTLDQLIQDMADQLGTDAVLAAVGVIPDRVRLASTSAEIFEDTLANALNATGMAVVIRPPRPDVENPNLVGPQQEVTLFVDIYKSQYRVPSSNNVPLADLVERAMVALHHYNPAQFPNHASYIVAGIPGLDDSFDRETVTVKAQNVSTVAISQVATPSVSIGASLVTLACATGGAAIFYTTDGSTPSPTNGTLYTAPYAKGISGTVHKAKAFLAGYLASDVGSGTVA